MAAKILLTLVFLAGLPLPGTAQNRNGGASGDTSHARTIVYFGPAQSELDVLSGKDLGEAFDDFSIYISRADSTLRRLGIGTEYNASPVIIVPYGEGQQIVVDRKIQPFGYIFIDGKKRPLVIDYVLTDLDLIETAKDFFGLKQARQ